MAASATWTGAATNGPAAVYLSADSDSRMLPATHPEHIRVRAGGMPTPEPVSFYVHVDKKPIANGSGLTFEDDRTRVTEQGREAADIAGCPAHLLKLTVGSDRYPDRNVAVLRIEATNEHFTELALAEDWKTHLLITVCDGCRGWGGNDRCEVEITGRRETNLQQLKPEWLLTDHFKPDRGDDWDPRPGQLVKPTDPKRFPLRFVHTCALAGPKYHPDGDHNRYPGRFARLYEVVPVDD